MCQAFTCLMEQKWFISFHDITHVCTICPPSIGMAPKDLIAWPSTYTKER